jgi:hypothetical protein
MESKTSRNGASKAKIPAKAAVRPKTKAKAGTRR